MVTLMNLASEFVAGFARIRLVGTLTEFLRIRLRRTLCTLALATAAGACQIAPASNVDLSTVPRRNTVQLTIYNSEDITLVRETRVVTFKKGINPLQFSWANTLIDPSSVELKFLIKADQLDVV